MKLTPQAVPNLFDAPWTARRLADAGVCLLDERGQPAGPADPFFADYALPRLADDPADEPAGVVRVLGTVRASRDEMRPVTLLAADCSSCPDGIDEAAWSRWTDALPRHSPASLQRLAAGLDGLVQTAGRAETLKQEVRALSDELSDSYEELSLVYQLGSSITVSLPTRQFLMAACTPAAAVMEASGVGVLTWDKRLGDQPPLFFGQVDLSDADVERIDAALRQLVDPVDPAAVVLLNDVRTSPQLAWLYPKVRQILAVPMRRHDQTFGCVFAVDKDVPPEIFGTFNRGVFTSLDTKMLGGVAVHVALFLENHKLFGDAQALMMGLLHSLVAAVDAKDAYTCGHSVRVALFAKRLAEAAGYDREFCERVYFGGLLHDVGKIGVSDAVLRKPGKLTDEEFAEIKRHPEVGHRILQGVPQIHDVLPGVLHHHEKYNGRGYPHALAGDDIPLLGRLMCIADSFDAMTSSRTYRTAMPLEKAMAEILACAGTQFDPHLAELFGAIPQAEIEGLINVEREDRGTRQALLPRAA